MKQPWITGALAAAALLGGCAVGPDYHRPAPPGGTVPKLSESAAAETAPTPLPPGWWRLFADPALDGLVERALARNTDLRVAAANLQRARAVLSEARAGKLPVSTLTASYVRQRFGGQVFNAVSGVPPVTTDFYSTGVDASYEVDLFGGVSRTIRAAIADSEAAQAQVDAARVAVVAETARTYSYACALGEQIDLLRRAADLSRQMLVLTETTSAAGLTDRRAIVAARGALAEAQAQLEPVDGEWRATLFALAFLLGDPPEAIDEAASRCRVVPRLASPLPVGDGAALLARRPDIRVAERQLARDTERIGIATAALYPTIRFGGTASLGAPSLGNLGNSGSFGFSAGPSISWTFPFTGAVRARIRAARADEQASLARFDAAVLRALQETEQAMARLRGAARAEEELQQASSAASEAADLVRHRFRAGAEDMQKLLDSERIATLAAKNQAVAEAERAAAQIQLFKALGGGWETAGSREQR